LFLLVVYIAIIGYYHYLLLRAKTFVKNGNQGSTTVTVVIPARNEANNIINCLNSIASQSYNTALWNIIVVDDYSTDNTVQLVKDFINNHQQISVTLLSLKAELGNQKINSYKKKGIAIAVQQAQGELIVTTDADCVVKPTWLETLVAFYKNTNAQCIAAPVRLVNDHGELKKKYNLVQAFQTLDFLTLQGITIGSVAANKHTMCNGANFAFTKVAFETVKGYNNVDKIASGDDVLLMQKIKKAYPNQVHYLKSKNAIVNSLTEKTWWRFMNQRIRWASKANYYDDKLLKYVMLIVLLINTLSLLLVFTLFFDMQHWAWIAIFLLLKFTIDLRFVSLSAKYFNQKYLLKWFPICFLLHPFYIIISGLLGKFGRFTWKGRRVH
jgi:cellulose synthase/poly-beta-1,6-N-acetylglucosamine synthase-like glycosyltransferase